jgi:subtilisin family serine protease
MEGVKRLWPVGLARTHAMVCANIQNHELHRIIWTVSAPSWTLRWIERLLTPEIPQSQPSRRGPDPHSLPLSSRSTAPDAYAPHIMGGVNTLRAEGYSGTGIFIGIVDTGVDYNHPALGGGFGPGFKICAGYDLVGDIYDGTSDPIPDSDPMDCDGHGTHGTCSRFSSPPLQTILGFAGFARFGSPQPPPIHPRPMSRPHCS